MTTTDRVLSAADSALRTLFAQPRAARPTPLASASAEMPLSEPEKRVSGALMRVNHVGEVCAQALYTAQAMTTNDPVLRQHLDAAAREETDHLAWTQKRIDDLGSHASVLNPLWYLGAFGLGLLAGRLGDATSLGFVAETERQVEAHLDGHLDRLPAGDTASRAVIEQMKLDEARHAAQASGAGAKEAAKAAGVFWKQEAEMLRQARNWSLAALDEVLDSVNTADVATKTTGSPDHLIAERLLLEIAGRARRLGL